jgi:hypothetical protein
VLAAAAAAFAAGLLTGLGRLGLPLPGAAGLAEWHGALMIGGFLGTVISLERAVAIGRLWAYAAPALSALAAVVLLSALILPASVLLLAAGICLTVNSIWLTARQPALFTGTLAVAAACWVAGTCVWIAGGTAPQAAGWWLAFLILTIASERLELSRLLTPPWWSGAIFCVAAASIIVGAIRNEFAGPAGVFAGAGLLIATAWLVRYDVARRTVRLAGLARFSATCLLAGYFWLAVAGGLLLLGAPGNDPFVYDAAIHAITIGFVLSMIFGHAPIILPAVTGWRVRYGQAAYAALALLHASVLLRVAADLTEAVDVRVVSGPMTVLALMVYAATLLFYSLRTSPVR